MTHGYLDLIIYEANIETPTYYPQKQVIICSLKMGNETILEIATHPTKHTTLYIKHLHNNNIRICYILRDNKQAIKKRDVILFSE